jgi:CHASE3 domain sensor protein
MKGGENVSGGFESKKLDTLVESYYSTLDYLDEYIKALKKNLTEEKEQNLPDNEQRTELLEGQIKQAQVLFHLLNEKGLDQILKMVDSANGPWNVQHFLNHNW